ncbi:MAG: hypothetical protein M0Q13_12680 [Methanothrix sp.]|nr:hypothetical protein [Methanothrix sp.]
MKEKRTRRERKPKNKNGTEKYLIVLIGVNKNGFYDLFNERVSGLV